MPTLTSRRGSRLAARRGSAIVCATGLAVASLASGAHGTSPASVAAGSHLISFHGFQIAVPSGWLVVDLTTNPDACLRFDQPVVYVGHAGDQADCPSRVIGGAPGLQLEALDAGSSQPTTPAATVPPGGDLTAVRLPSIGPVAVAVEGAGVLVTGVYGPQDAALMEHVLTAGIVLPTARPAFVSSLPTGQAAPAIGQSVPGTYSGKGFDTCAAPSQSAMDAWWAGTDYASVGIYIGGISRGCAQPNLTPSWVSAQVRVGWHLIPTYVGRQAPCTGFNNRMSYNPATASAQGSAEANDAMARATALGIAAPSTIYVDIEGYNSSIQACVTAVLSYVSGWTRALHMKAYEAGVYSSASSGIHDLSTHYNNMAFHRPDDLWIAWWNGKLDVDGGGYVPDSQWSYHQRVHQYSGNVRESHGGYTFSIDRNYLDVSALVAPPRGCPTNLDFEVYRVLKMGFHGDEVVAAQCLLAMAGFDPGAATGIYGWRAAAAMQAFKASRGLNSDDAAIRRWAWTALTSAGPTQFLQLGSTGLRVSKVQRALTARLQRVVAISGTFDVATRNAVIAYQTARGLTPTGTVGVPTWYALQAGL